MKKRKLWMRWSKKEQDMLFFYPTRPSDGHLVHSVLNAERMYMDYHAQPPRIAFDKSFVKELEARGYDITTLKFECTLKDNKDA